MIVYRLEKNGIGPFVQEWVYRKKLNKWSLKKHKRYVISWIDKEIPLQKITPIHIFGCSSKTSLRAYFGYTFKAYFKEGYRIKRYIVPDNEIINWGYEVAFPIKYHKLQSVGALKRRLKASR